MSFPLCGNQLSFKQPDGTKFDGRAWGDQQCARFESLDGHEFVRDPASHFYCYAVQTAEQDELRPSQFRVALDAPPPQLLATGPLLPASDQLAVRPQQVSLPRPRWRERLEERQAAERLHTLTSGILPAPPQRGTVGDYWGLCLLIDFADAPATISLEEVDAFCNNSGYRGFGNNGSVFDYFLDNSGGRLRYRTKVLPYYRARFNKSYYIDERQPYGERARDLIKEAMAFHVSQGADLTGLTVDGSQRVFATNVFYAGTNDNNWGYGLWPHASRLAAPFRLTPTAFADDYQVCALNNELSLGIYCHENGHMLCDFPDLYNYANQKKGVGRYCLMCLGGNADAKNPVNVGAYLRYRAGWGTAVTLQRGTDVHAQPAEGRFYIHAKGAGEYFIVEARKQSGRDAALPATGLAVWHVDELGSNAEPELAPSGHRHLECRLVQADGLGDLDLGQNDGDQGDLFGPATTPIFRADTEPSSRWRDGSPSGLQIRGIKASTEGMEFSVD